jgi:hypothetical protein
MGDIVVDLSDKINSKMRVYEIYSSSNREEVIK